MRTTVSASSVQTPAAKPRSTRSPRAMILRDRVLAYVKRRGRTGATDEEISHALGMPGNTARPRRIELRDACRIEHDGRFRPTVSGRSAAVWVFAR